jgi:predicted AAA+ superfamily ATPase
MNDSGFLYAALTDLASLSVFSGIRKHSLIRAFEKLLGTSLKTGVSGDAAVPLKLIRRWSGFVHTLIRYPDNPSFSGMLRFLTAAADNPFTRAAERGKVPPPLALLAQEDLSRLGRIAGFDFSALGECMAGDIFREPGAGYAAAEGRTNAGTVGPDWAAIRELFPPNADWGRAAGPFADYIRAHGAGKLGLYSAFRWASALKPVPGSDPVRLGDLAEYAEQRSVVVANTLRFLEGKPANNLLLYGDRGTGKSATVKAVCNEYASRGLRLVEVGKEDLPQFPRILRILSRRALRFIIFIDDLSFESVNDSFTALKALLEGGVEAKPANIAIYATSNRRHLVKENFADRPNMAGEVRSFDTMQEQFSLADRFGLTVIFSAPAQEEYLRIAEFIAEKRGLLPEGGAEEERRLFRENAVRWERWFNGRSPRTAVQYVDWAAGGADFPWEQRSPALQGPSGGP